MRVRYINLVRRSDRNARFLELNAGIADFERVEAVDGSAVSAEELTRQGVVEETLKCYTPGGIGSAMSHRRLWQECAAGGCAITVAEDDAVFNRRFVERAAGVLERLPAKWDIVLWGWNFDSLLCVDLFAGLERGVFTFDGKKLDERVRAFRDRDHEVQPLRLLAAFGLVCYSVSPQGAERLERLCFPLRNERIDVAGFGRPMANVNIDAAMNKFYPSLQAYVAFPPLVWTENDKADSDINRKAAGNGKRLTPGPSPQRGEGRNLGGPSLPETGAFNRRKRCRYGEMVYNVHDRYVGRSLELYGEYCEREVEIFRQLVGPGDWVVDVGANLGTHTLFFARQVGPSGRVVAFEPQRIVFQALCANMALNSVANVLCQPYAVGAEPGEIGVPALDYGHENNFGGLTLGGAEGDRVPVLTLDSLELPACRLIKIDVEGMERDVLAGAIETIARHRPLLYVENDRDERAAELIRFIDGLGYAMYWHQPLLYNRDNFLGNQTNVFGRIASRNMFCVPHGAAVCVQGFEPVEVPTAREAVAASRYAVGVG
jgi:FkbM family methyltransferase